MSYALHVNQSTLTDKLLYHSESSDFVLLALITIKMTRADRWKAFSITRIRPFLGGPVSCNASLSPGYCSGSLSCPMLDTVVIMLLDLFTWRLRFPITPRCLFSSKCTPIICFDCRTFLPFTRIGIDVPDLIKMQTDIWVEDWISWMSCYTYILIETCHNQCTRCTSHTPVYKELLSAAVKWVRFMHTFYIDLLES